MKTIKDPSLAKNPFDFNRDIKEKISYIKWVEFIEKNSDFFTWLEDTEKGKQTLDNIDDVPQSFREGLLKGHNKSRAFGDYNLKEGYFEMYVDYHGQYGKISTTFMKPIKKEHLQLLLKMAKHCEALLLDNGNKIITPEMVVDDSLS